jgi:hypothetical protein
VEAGVVTALNIITGGLCEEWMPGDSWGCSVLVDICNSLRPAPIADKDLSRVFRPAISHD